MNKEIFDNVTLFNGDSLTILSGMAAESVDAILTDPPYSSGGTSTSARQADPAKKYQQSGCKKQYPPHAGRCQGSAQLDHVVYALAGAVLARGAYRSAPDGVPP